MHVPEVRQTRRAAAFYDLDGTLCSTNIVHAYAFYAKNQPSIFKSVRRTVSLVASVPFFFAADAYSRALDLDPDMLPSGGPGHNGVPLQYG